MGNRHSNNWKLINKDTDGATGQEIRNYRVDNYMISLQNCSGVYHIIDSNFDLCDVKNESSKSIGALFRKISTLFI